MKTNYKKLNDVRLTNYKTDIVVRKGFKFYVFDDINELEEWANDKEDIHEVILDERPCKIYFDIDARKDEVEYSRDILVQGIYTEIKSMLQVNFDIELEDNELIICERHREDKWSFHIIIRNYYVERKNTIKQMLELEHVKNKYGLWQFIDRQVYKSNGSLSISNGTYKGNKMKVKGEYTFPELLISCVPENYQKVEAMLNEQSNEASLGNTDISDAFINKVIQYVEKCQDNDLKHYKLRVIHGNIIEFKRATNGIHQCSLCGGQHTADNKLYITCFEQNDIAYLHCRNTNKKKVIYKGQSKLTLGEYINIIKPNEETYKMDEIQTSPLIEPYQFNDDKILLIKSPCGTGKTKRLIEFLKPFEKIKILVISFRISLTNELSNKMSELGMKSYLDTDAKQKWNSQFYEYEGFIEERLIIQYESLHKVNDDMEYDIVVIDEMESVMEQMFSPTNSKHFNVNLITLNGLIRNTKHVICLDAYMGRRTLNYLGHLKQDIHSIYNNYQAEKGNTYYITKSTDTIYQKIKEELRKHKRVVICSSCSTDETRGLYKSLVKEFPTKIGKLYTSKSPKEMKNDLKNVEAAWKGVDYLIYSPTIMAGVSFESENFDVLFGLASNHSCGTKAFIQMLKRIRNIKERRHYIGIRDVRTKYLETHRDKISDNLRRNLKKIMGELQLSSFKTLNEFDKFKLNLYIDYTLERNKDTMLFLPRFVSYLKEYGAQIKVIDKDEVSGDVKDIKDHIKELKATNIKRIVEADDIDEYDCSALQWNQENLTEEEQYRLAKYFLKRRYNYSGELDEEKVEFMNKNLNKEIVGNLKVLNRHPTLDDLQSQEVEDIITAQNPYDIISNSLYLKRIILNDIFELFGYQFDFETLKEEKSKEITGKDIKSAMKVYLTAEKQVELRRLHSYNNQINVEDLKSINTLINHIFKIFNFKMTFIRKKGTDGKIYKIAFDDMYYIDEETEKVMIEL